MKYKKEFMSLSEIGELFGQTSHEIGKVLKDQKYRVGSEPSNFALNEKMVQRQEYDNNQRMFWIWNAEKTAKILERAGFELISNPPQKLVEHSYLNGPFEMKTNSTNGFDILNADHTVALTVFKKENGEKIIELLNLAHAHGKF